MFGRMYPLALVLDAIVDAFNRDCQVISEALTNSLTESFTLSRKVSQNFWKIYWNAFSPFRPMEEVNKNGDDLFNAVCGDLGLGETQRSSFFLNYDLEVNKYLSSPAYHEISTTSLSDSDLSSVHHDGKYRFQDLFKKGFLHSVLSLTHGQKHGSDYDHAKSDSESEIFPTYADVPYGTSYRQQKKLYEQEMDHLRQQQSASVLLENSSSRVLDRHGSIGMHLNLSPLELDAKLLRAIEEMDELKVELDACCKRLDAKYQAVAILKKQAEIANSELQTSQDKFQEKNKDLEKEVSKLRFELEWRESSFMDSQQTWADRFDQVCKENNLLMSKLEARSEELRRMTAHKCALARERDELLALLDVAERLKYEQGKSCISEDEYGSFSSSELAVLGACKCRGADPEPCGCAHAAASLRKEVAKLREERELIHQRHQEAQLTVDAYRTAFEEQLTKTRILSQRMSELSTLTSRSVKAKAAMKYLIQVLADDEIEDGHFLKKDKEEELKSKQEMAPMNLHELLQILTDMVIEKKEILAHQKLASKVLANKLGMYENSTKPPSLLKHSSDPNDLTASTLQGKEILSEKDQGQRTPGETPTEEENCPSTGIDQPSDIHGNQEDVNQMTKETSNKMNEDEYDKSGLGYGGATVTEGQTMPCIHEYGEEDSCGDRDSGIQDSSCPEVDALLNVSITSSVADQGESVEKSEKRSSVHRSPSETKSGNPFESSAEEEEDLGDSIANADNGSSDVIGGTAPPPKPKSLNPFESEEEEEEIHPDGDQGHSASNHQQTHVPSGGTNS